MPRIEFSARARARAPMMRMIFETSNSLISAFIGNINYTSRCLIILHVSPSILSIPRHIYLIPVRFEFRKLSFACNATSVAGPSGDRGKGGGGGLGDEVRESLGREGFCYLVNQLSVHDRIDVLRELVQQKPIAKVEHTYDTLGFRFLQHAGCASQEVHPRPGLRENYDPANGIKPYQAVVSLPFLSLSLSLSFSLSLAREGPCGIIVSNVQN